MDFEEDILLKLRRQFGKDEYVALLNQELAESKIEVGTLKSEVAYLENELTILKKKKNNEVDLNYKITQLTTELTESNKEIRNSKVYKDLHEKNISLSKNINRIKDNNNALISQIVKLKNEI